MRAIIVGASGGIGAALSETLAQRGWQVLALSRRGISPAHENIVTGFIDICDEDSIAAAARAVGEDHPPQLVVVATGLLSGINGVQPEKTYRHQSMNAFQTVFQTNTFGPALVAKYFLPLMPRRGRAIFAALSARVGSIGDNRIGGWHAYRSSKAALNMLIKNFAIEQTRRNPDFVAVSLHPGTVDTDLSRPFQAGVPDKSLFTPQTSAAYLADVLANLKSDDTGKAFDWAGQEIPA
ncbi:MAG: SDR family NAD(P)-dependent oxidoreductase [Henriciella sp.]